MRELGIVLALFVGLAGCEEDDCEQIQCSQVFTPAVWVTVTAQGASTAPEVWLTVTAAPGLAPGNDPVPVLCTPIEASALCTTGGSAGEYAFEVSSPGYRPESREVVVATAIRRGCCDPDYTPESVEVELVPEPP